MLKGKIVTPLNSATKEDLETKADLVNGKVPEAQLPSYVDDVTEYASLSEFPDPGEQGKIYVALDTGFTYRWSGSEYIQIGGQDLSNFYTKSEANALLAAKQDNITTTSAADGNIVNTLGFDAAGNIVKRQQKKTLTLTAAELETFATNMSTMLEFNMAISAYTTAFQNADAITLQSQDGATINFTLYRVQLLHDSESGSDVAGFVGSAIIPGLNTYDLVLLDGTLTVKSRVTIKEYSTETQYNKYDLCLYAGKYCLCRDATQGVWDSSKWIELPDVAATLTTPTQLLAFETNYALFRKQDTLVTGTNIKSVNSTSILGAGNVNIDALEVLTSAPSADNVGLTKIVHLATEPATKYNGYIYLIDEEG